jgi:hypothetical protein
MFWKGHEMKYYYAAGTYNPHENPPLDGIDTLEWTTEPPTQDGWFWAIGPGNPVVVRVIEGNPSHFVGFINGVGGAYPVDYFSHWLGPLPIPEPPK